MLISILVPVRNEEKFIQECIRSILDFEIPPGYEVEIIVLDGMSDDRTAEILRTQFGRSPIRVVSNEGKIASTALNKGIRMSGGEFIMRLDAHASYSKDYLKELVRTAESVDADNIGGVCITRAGGTNYGAQVVQAMLTHPFGVGNSGFRVGHKSGYTDTVPYGFFRREIFDKIGYFDERLVRSQDYEMNRRIIASGGKVWQNPDVRIDYFSQKSIAGFARKQFCMAGPFIAYMWFLAPYSLAFRHLVIPFFSAGVVAGGLYSLFFPAILPLYLLILAFYTGFAIFSSIQQAVRFRNWFHVIVLPFCFFLFHFIRGAGGWLGVLKLLTGKAPIFRLKEPWKGAGRFRVKVEQNKTNDNVVR
jgi:glycosyltransferase involved in cell wall biosynthesis